MAGFCPLWDGSVCKMISRPREMEVIPHALEVAVPIAMDDQRLIAPGEQVAAQLLPLIAATGVSAQQPLHPGDQIWLVVFRTLRGNDSARDILTRREMA